MSRRIGPLPYRKVARALQRLGFVVIRQVGSHVVHQNPDGRIAIVPHHAREDLHAGFLKRILKDAQVPLDEFEEAL